MARKRALIIGGGIGGPAAALFLQRAGVDVEIFEAAAEPDDYAGAFLNVASNGLAVLHTLGLEAQVSAIGFACPNMIISSGSGKQLGAVHNGAAPGQGPVSVVIKRGALHKVLRDAALGAGIPIHFGKRLDKVATLPDGQVVAHFADGSLAHGDLLIGCDGIGSRVRSFVEPAAPPPVYTGQLSGGGFAHGTGLAPTLGTQHFIFGKRAFFGYLVRESGEVYWFCNLAYPGAPRRSELAAISEAAWREQLRDLYRDDTPLIREIIEATEGSIGMYPIYDVPSVPRWSRGSVALLGDAAHATSPSAGQGASIALEDAVVLAKCVRDLPTIEAAFAAYERLRKPRAERVVKYSRARGSNKVAAGAITRWLRDTTMPLFLRLFANAGAQAWLYAYHVDWAAPTDLRSAGGQAPTPAT